MIAERSARSVQKSARRKSGLPPVSTEQIRKTNSKQKTMTITLQNDRLIRALLRQPVDKTPIWIMRQAGRYLPEYRALRKQAGDFLTLCKTPDLAAEITLQPLARFPLDAAIIFSDILTIPDAMGLGLHFVENEGPKFHRPIKTARDVAALSPPDPETALRYVMDAITTTRKALAGSVPLIGFSGSPWTVATYMVEGGSSKNFSKVKGLRYQSPEVMHQLLDTLAQSVQLYLNAQIAAGAQAVMIFDTWGGILTPQDYRDFSLAYMQKIVSGLTRQYNGQPIPVTLFTKNGGQHLAAMAETGCDALGVDWTVNLSDARARVQDKVALQGNMDPCLLYASPEDITRAAQQIMDSYGPGPGHVFNLGHGIHPDVPPEHVAALVEAVHAYACD